MSEDLRNFTLEKAAEILCCDPRHLEDNLKRYPHQKIGRSVAFDATDIRRIKDMCRVEPQVPAAPAKSSVTTLANLRPSRSRRAG